MLLSTPITGITFHERARDFPLPLLAIFAEPRRPVKDLSSRALRIRHWKILLRFSIPHMANSIFGVSV